MKPVPVSRNAHALRAFEKQSLLIVVKNEEFSFHQKAKSPGKIIFNQLTGTSSKNNPDEIDVNANDPGWYSSYE